MTEGKEVTVVEGVFSERKKKSPTVLRNAKKESTAKGDDGRTDRRKRDQGRSGVVIRVPITKKLSDREERMSHQRRNIVLLAFA